MYTDFFGLTEHPFELHTDSRFLYLSPAHARTQAFLTYAVLKRDGIVAITGDIGAGKSTMIEDLRQNVDPAYRLVVLHQTQLDDLELLKLFLLELGVRETTSGKAQTLGRIRRALIEGHDRGEKAVLIVDDAQNLSPAAIEELRMLADDECDGQRLLGLVLIGQRSLRQTLCDESLAQVRQRVRLHYKLDPLAPDQVGAYVAHRLAVAGCDRDNVFDAEAIELIALYSGGVPRLINILCDMSMTGSALKNSATVTVRGVSEALEELGWSRPELAGGWRSGLGYRALLGIAGAWDRLGGAASKRVDWADGTKRAPAALARLGAHRQAQIWRRHARAIADRTITATTAVTTATRRTLEDAQVAAERAANTPAGGGLLSDLRWGIGGLYLARKSIATTLALGVFGVLFAMRMGPSSGAATTADSASVVDLAVPEALFVEVVKQSAQALDRSESSAASGEPDNLTTALRMNSTLAKTSGPATVNDVLPETNLAIRSPDWLLAQSPEAYTVQIIGARNTSNLARFARRNGLGDELAYYTLERKGEALYLLVNGVYESAEAAAEARSAMPADVQVGKPWIRTLADIQSSIRESRAINRVVLIDQPAATTR